MRFITSPLTSIIMLAIAGLCVTAISFSTTTTQEKSIYKPTGSEGTIGGTISFVGKPKRVRIDMSLDPFCETANPGLTDEEFVVNNQRLANVFVYVQADFLNKYLFKPPSSDVLLEHKGCRYAPHVLGIQTQQILKIINRDSTAHNTWGLPKVNPEWNRSQQPGSAVIEQSFAWPEVFIPIRDNQHPWQKAYVGVLPHPFFAVSNTNGSYKISGLPPGHYTVVALHERLGKQTVDVLLADTQQKNLDFTFKGY